MVSFIGLVGAMMALGGSVGYFVFPTGLSMGVKMMVNLAENGMVYPKYMKPPLEPVSTYWLFAIRNPKQVLQGERPQFNLKGPYKFKTILVRDQIKFNTDGERVVFDIGRLSAWIEANSSNPDERMWIINPVLPSTLRTVNELIMDRIPFKRLAEPVVFNTVNLLLDTYKERLIMRTTPRKLMNGRKIELLEALSGVANRFGVSSLLPPTPPDNMFGLIYVQNRTITPIELWTGVGETRNKYAEVRKFKGKDRLDFWQGHCNAISGTNGELYKPFLTAGEPLRVFLAPLCRSLELDPLGKDLIETESGVKGLQYEFSGRLFQGARNNPANKCFCKNKRTYDCQYDGLFAMSACFFQTPLFFANVNFKKTDPKIAQLVDLESVGRPNGSDPDWRLPEGQNFTIEPITGTVLEVKLSLMALIKVVRQSYMRDLASVQNLTYMPFFVTSDQLALPFNTVWQIYFLQKFNDYYKPIMAGWALSGVGVIVVKFLIG